MYIEQCHSPYLAMLGDPANFIDPDGRAGIPFLQDFMETGVGDFLECAIGASPGLGFAVLDILGPLGGTISSIVSIGASIYSAGSSVQTLAEISQAGAEKTYGADDVGTDVYCSTSNANTSSLSPNNFFDSNSDVAEEDLSNDSKITLTMRMTETSGLWDSEYIVWNASFTLQFENIILQVSLSEHADVYWGMPRNEWNEKGNFHPNNVNFPIRYKEMTHGVEAYRNLTFTSDGIQFFHRGMSLAQSSGCFVSSGLPNYVFREIQSGTNEAGVTSSWEVWDCFTQPDNEPSSNPYDRSTKNLISIKQLYDQLGGKKINFNYRFGDPGVNNAEGDQFLKSIYQAISRLRI